MPTPIIRGTLDPKLQRETYKFDPQSGDSLVQTFENFSAEQMQVLADDARRKGVAYEITRQFDHYTMVAQDTRGEITIDTWQVQQNEESPSIFTNPLNFIGLGWPGSAALGKSVATVMAQALKDGSVFEAAWQKLKDDTGVEHAAPPFDTDYQIRFWQRVQQDQTQFYRSGYVLRHTTNVSNRYDRNVSDEYVDCIYSVSELLTECEDANLWVYPLPGRLSYKIQAIDADFQSRYPAPANYQWGWLKRGSTESTAANNRVDLTTEYWLAPWSTDEYLQR